MQYLRHTKIYQLKFKAIGFNSEELITKCYLNSLWDIENTSMYEF